MEATNSLKINGVAVCGVSNLKQKIKEHFIDWFTEKNSQDVDLVMGDLSKISPIQSSGLEVQPSSKEVKAIWTCKVEKASGFDGFNLNFLGKCGIKLSWIFFLLYVTL